MTATNHRTATLPPLLTADDQSGLRDFWRIYDAHYDEIQAALIEELSEMPAFADLMRARTPEQAAAESRLNRELMRRALVEDDWQPYLDHLHQQGETYAQMDIDFTAWFAATSAFRNAITPLLTETFADQPDRATAARRAVNRFSDTAMATIGDAYLTSREETIRRQEEAIRELSTPVLQLREGLLILPIIGVLDSYRARHLTDQLLRAIRARRAKMVVLDLTGVPAVDSAVANHLLQTIQAARLVGARAIVTGLSPENAQTLVRLGLDVTNLNAMGDLQDGIEEANRLLGYRVVKVGDPLSSDPLMNGQ